MQPKLKFLDRKPDNQSIMIRKIVSCFRLIINKNLFYYIHLPYYNIIKYWVDQKTKNTVFYDSVLFAVLLFTYPLFLLIIFVLLYQLSISLTIILINLVAIPLVSKFASK